MKEYLHNYNTLKPAIFYPAVLPSTAILRTRYFNYADFTNFDRDLFSTLHKKKIHNLVIDLRNNSGGRADLTIDLLSYLVTRPYLFIYKCRTVTDADTLKKYYGQYNTDISAAGAARLLNHLCRKDSLSIEPVIYPHKKRFKGKVYILMNSGTFSAATLFAVTLKLFGNCTTIGSETGGGLDGTDGKEIMNITLPNTRLQLMLPLAFGYTVARQENEGRGLMPDLRLDIDRHEFYNFRDDGKLYEILKRVIGME